MTDAGVETGRWREGGKLGQWLLQASMTKQLDVTFVFASRLGIGHEWQAAPVLCPDVTLNYL